MRRRTADSITNYVLSVSIGTGCNIRAQGDTHIRSVVRPIGVVAVHMRPAMNGGLK